MANNKTIAGDTGLLAYRLRTGCPKCGTALVNVVLRTPDSEGGTKYCGNFYSCPKDCRSPVSGTRYSIGHPDSNGIVRESDMGTGDYRRPYNGPKATVVKRTVGGGKQTLRSR
jgi:hypothetical protein